MRLIDADSLDLVIHVPSQNNAVCQQIADEVGRQIANAPTVEAIPIEWIKQYISRKIANDVSLFHWWSIFATDCKDMYEEWEKENGQKEQ